MKNEYFILTGQEGNPIPRVINWHDRLDIRKLTREHYRELPPFFLLDMETGADLFYPDILAVPFLMVSPEAMGVIQMYDDKIPFKLIALFDPAHGENAAYYCPVLNNLEESPGRGRKEYLFHIRSGDKQTVVIHEALAESLLIRGASGMHIEEWEE